MKYKEFVDVGNVSDQWRFVSNLLAGFFLIVRLLQLFFRIYATRQLIRHYGLIFGLLSGSCPYDVKTVEPTRLLLMGHEAMFDLMADYPYQVPRMIYTMGEVPTADSVAHA